MVGEQKQNKKKKTMKNKTKKKKNHHHITNTMTVCTGLMYQLSLWNKKG